MSLLPHNATLLERSLERASEQGIDPEIIRGIADSARCPPDFLPWLGWAWKVEGWEAANTNAQRRELVREAVPVHKTKGTVGAIRRVLKAVRVNADFKEWHQIPNAAPYTFQVTAWANDNREGEGSIISPQLGVRLRALVDAAKNERSHYDFRLGARFDGGFVLANAARSRLLQRLSVEAKGVPVDPAEQGLRLGNATNALCVARQAVELQSEPINAEGGAQFACAARALAVVCGSRPCRRARHDGGRSMSTPLQPVITKAGLAAIFTADNTGLSAKIGSIVLGTSGYTPDASQKSLVNQVAEYPITGGERLSSTLLHIVALADGNKAFWAREIGFKLTDGTLLAVWSHPTEALAYKAANTDILLAYDLSLAALPADSVTIVSGEAGLSLSLAAPLAAQAASLVAGQLRDLQQQDQLDAQGEKQRIAGEVLANLLSRMKVAEQRLDADREAMLSAVVSNAAAIISLQTFVIKQTYGA